MPIPLDQAEKKASLILDYLTSTCDDIIIAGSIRRKNRLINDIEIVARPKFLQRDLFGEAQWSSGTVLGLQIDDLVRRGALAWDKQVPRNGERYKRLIVQSVQIPIDIFLADEHNFGNICAIRTGNADFSRYIVTSVNLNGLLPAIYSHHNGYLWEGQKLISCPTETSFFAALGLKENDIPQPPQRNVTVIDSLRDRIKRSS